MKKYFILSVLLLVSGFFASCNYLNIDDYFEDTFQEDSIYANKRNIERYFNWLPGTGEDGGGSAWPVCWGHMSFWGRSGMPGSRYG